VFHGIGCRQQLREFCLRLRNDAALAVKDDRATGRGALVERQNELAGHEFLPRRDAPPSNAFKTLPTRGSDGIPTQRGGGLAQGGVMDGIA
jgi:hypothetical protein